MIRAQESPPMSLEQLMILASQLAQTPRLPVAAARPVRTRAVSASAQLSAQELEALGRIWDTPLRSQLGEPSSPVRH